MTVFLRSSENSGLVDKKELLSASSSLPVLISLKQNLPHLH